MCPILGQSNGEHNHAHGHGGGWGMPAGARRLALSLLLTLTLMVTEALGGWISGSLSLISDAGHMLTDAAALGLALLPVLFGGRPADPKRTYGFRRLEVLAAQVNVVGLLALTAWVAMEAVDRLRSGPQPIQLSLMAGIAALGL